jgi:hypothetical protein
MMTKFEKLVMQNILQWAFKVHGNYENFSEMLEDYWDKMLNTDTIIDPMWCDGDSEPFMNWDYSSPQPEVSDLWDSNSQAF